MLARLLSSAVFRFSVINQRLASVQMTSLGFGSADTLAHSEMFVSGVGQALCHRSRREICVQETPITVRKFCCPNNDEGYVVAQ
jgi:hypothetical protein